MPLVKTSRFLEGVSVVRWPVQIPKMGNEPPACCQDHERGERGPRPLGFVLAGEDREPDEVQHSGLWRGYRLNLQP